MGHLARLTGKTAIWVTDARVPLGPSNANAWSSNPHFPPSPTLHSPKGVPSLLLWTIPCGLASQAPCPSWALPPGPQEVVHLHQAHLALLLKDTDACAWPQTLESSLRVEPEVCMEILASSLHLGSGPRQSLPLCSLPTFLDLLPDKTDPLLQPSVQLSECLA